jgi:serine/threonine protein phosphatase PrpC
VQLSDNSSLGVQHVAATDIGMRRANNQDSYAVVPATSDEGLRRTGHLFLVADGMGAHAAGELASKLAVDAIPHTYHKLCDQPTLAALRRAIEDANRIIHNRGQANFGFQGMGTTSTALVLKPEGAWVAHVGDSRLYRLRGCELQQWTFDHSLAWEVRAAGQDLGTIPANIITRSLGPNPTVEVDVEGPLPAATGDVFLLCSDGLSGPVPSEQIGMILRCLPLEEAVAALVDLANLHGGPDNITVVAVRLKEDWDRLCQPTAHPEEASVGGSGLAVWATLLLGLAASLALLLLHWVVGAAAAVVAIIAALALHVRARGTAAPQPRAEPSGRQGPHGIWDCRPTPAFAEELRRILDDLLIAVEEEHWQIDRAELDRLTAQAIAAHQGDRLEEAVRNYCRAMSLVMRQLRKQGVRGWQRSGVSPAPATPRNGAQAPDARSAES